MAAISSRPSRVFDVPGEGDQVAPEAGRLEQAGGLGGVVGAQGVVELAEPLGGGAAGGIESGSGSRVVDMADLLRVAG